VLASRLWIAGPALLRRWTPGPILPVSKADRRGPSSRTGRVMRHILAFAVCGLSLCACTSGDLLKLDSSQVTLQLESEPPGADARVSNGATCKTPCSVPAATTAGDLTVVFALEGYQPQEASVQIVQSLDPREAAPRAVPNPVRVELVAVPRPPARRRPAARPPAPKKPAAQKQAPSRSAAPAPAPQQEPEAAPPPPSAPEPAASRNAPWPAPPPPSSPPPQNSPWPTPPPTQQ